MKKIRNLMLVGVALMGMGAQSSMADTGNDYILQSGMTPAPHNINQYVFVQLFGSRLANATITSNVLGKFYMHCISAPSVQILDTANKINEVRLTNMICNFSTYDARGKIQPAVRVIADYRIVAQVRKTSPGGSFGIKVRDPKTGQVIYSTGTDSVNPQLPAVINLVTGGTQLREF